MLAKPARSLARVSDRTPENRLHQGLVLLAGAAVVCARQAQPELDVAGLYLLGAGLGATAGLLLARRGFAVDPLGAEATIALPGTILALVGLVGLGNAVAGAIARR